MQRLCSIRNYSVDKGEEKVQIVVAEEETGGGGIESLTYPTYSCHYATNVDGKIQLHVIALGSCKPTGPFRKDEERQCFFGVLLQHHNQGRN